jgi:hypothetical protein
LQPAFLSVSKASSGWLLLLYTVPSLSINGKYDMSADLIKLFTVMGRVGFMELLAAGFSVFVQEIKNKTKEIPSRILAIFMS